MNRRNNTLAKFAIFILLLLFGSGAVWAKSIDRFLAEQMAVQVLKSDKMLSRCGKFHIASLQKIKWPELPDSLYLAVLKPRGFILLTTDDTQTPVIGYSCRHDFVGSAPLRTLLSRRLKAEIIALRENPSFAYKNQLRWRTSNPTGTLAKTSGDSVYYFPTPVWGQGQANGVYVFNYYTPHHWSAGCVATAMAEVLAYYQWPIVGTGSHCYNENDAGQLCADYSATYYDWANTLFKYEGERTTLEQRRAAGLLTYHTAISVNMDFSANGSTANVSNAPKAYHNYFRLSGHYKAVGESGFWTELINNMKDRRPAILAIHRSDGLGHAIVADGYSERNGFFHLNMGWNGSDNGWYDISGNWNAGGYNAVDGATKGLVPNPMILPDVHMLGDTAFVLSWRVSPKLKAQYFELQQSSSNNDNWMTLNAAIPDTFFTVHVSHIGNYYFRVRARRDDIWWDWSAIQKIALGGPRYLTFNVNMKFQSLGAQDSVVLRGNIPPLQGSMNSPALHDDNQDQIYSLTLPFDLDFAGQTLLYRFAIAGPGGTRLESFNRSYVIGYDAYQNLDTVYFDNYTNVNNDQILPESTRLLGNFPNPFNPGTVIRYRIGNANGKSIRVQLSVYNILGQKVALLVNTRQAPGTYRIPFQAKHLAPGIYFYRLKTEKQCLVGKMILIK